MVTSKTGPKDIPLRSTQSRASLRAASKGAGNAAKKTTACRRSSSAASLHPLTRHHNKTSASSTGALLEKRDAPVGQVITRCFCDVVWCPCCSPHGPWRNDGLQFEVSRLLEHIKPTKDESIDGDTDVLSSPASRRKRIVRGRLPAENPDEQFQLERAVGQETIDQPMEITTAVPLAKSRRPQSAPSRPKRLEEKASESKLRRPASASSTFAGRQKHKSKNELRADAVHERKRLLLDSFEQRCRAAWDAKVANMEGRVHLNAAERAATFEQSRMAIVRKKESAERARFWITILHVIRTVHCLQELAISGRMLLLASLGGAKLEKQMSWGKAAALTKSALAFSNSVSSFSAVHRADHYSPEQSRHPGKARSSMRWAAENKAVRIIMSDPRIGPSVLEKLRRATYIGHIFPDLRRASMMPLAPDGNDWSKYTCQVDALVVTRSNVWKMWSIPLICSMALARIRCRQRVRRSGFIVATTLIQITITNNIYLGVKRRFVQIRMIQWAVRDWISREATRYDDIAALLSTTENRMIKRMWADEDFTAIRNANQQLVNNRQLKERKACERIIEMSKERYRRYTKPRNDHDKEYVNDQLEKVRIPMLVRNLSTHHIYMCRKDLIKHELAEHAKQVEEYEREMQTWQDIDQAVKILDPASYNPDPVPEAPVHRPFGFTIAQPIGLNIVTKLRAWSEENDSLLQACIRKHTSPVLTRMQLRYHTNYSDATARPLGRFAMMEFMKRIPGAHRTDAASAVVELAQVNSAIRDIVKTAMLPEEAFQEEGDS